MLYSETIFVKILLPEKPYLTREKAMAEVPAIEGPYMILPQRAPTMKLLKTGILRLFETPDAAPEIYFVQGGVVKVRENGCTLLTTRIISAKDADKDAIKDELQKLLNTETQGAEGALTKHQQEVGNERKAFLQMVAGYLDEHSL